jgi:hypothetical protein
MKYFKSSKTKVSYLLLIGFLLLLLSMTYIYRAPIYRSVVTVNLGSLYIDYLNSKVQFINYLNNNNTPTISISMSPNNFVRMQRERSQMVNNYVISGSQWKGENNYYKINVEDGTTKTKGEIKLFGMNSDHFRNPNSHSFRIKFDGLKGYGNKKQNFLNPRSRDFITDPLLNIIYSRLYKGIGINYKPYRVFLNKVNYGVMYSEDFFDKYLIENNQRRESVIFEASNDSLEFNYLGEDNSLEDISKELSLLYKNNYKGFLKKIDKEKVKDVLKLSLISNSGHPFIDINLHWYYNPVTGLIEPTIREAFAQNLSEDDIVSFPTNLDLKNENKILNNILNKEDINLIISELLEELDEIESIIKSDTDYLNLKSQLIGYIKNIEIKESIIKDNIELLRTIKTSNLEQVNYKKEIVKIKNDTLITDDFTVKHNQKLIIQDNVTITLDGVYFKVYGGFQALGKQGREIKIIGKNNLGSLFFNTKDKVVFNNVIFENLTNLQSKYIQPSSLTFYECSSVLIDNSEFKSNISGDDYVNFFRSKNISIKNSLFKNTLNDAIDSDFSYLEIINSKFINIGNDAIDGSGSEIKITNNLFDTVLDKAISAGERSIIISNNNTFNSCEIALVSKDESKLSSFNNLFYDNSVDIAVFIKKRYYGFPELTIENSNYNKYLIEEGSRIIGIDSIEYTSNVESKLYGNMYGRASN